jgi:hypothetical protein
MMTTEKNLKIDFLQDSSKFSGFSDDFASQNKFQINLKYNIN